MPHPSLEIILAVITTDLTRVSGGGAPIFRVESQDELERVSLYLSRILEGAIHDLENGVYVIIGH